MSHYFKDEEIDNACVFLLFCVVLSFFLGIYTGMRVIKTTVDETEYTNTIQEITIPIGKLTKNISKEARLL